MITPLHFHRKVTDWVRFNRMVTFKHFWLHPFEQVSTAFDKGFALSTSKFFEMNIFVSFTHHFGGE